MSEAPEHVRTSHRRRAFAAPAAWLVLFITLGLGLTADLTTKAWSFHTVAGKPVVLNREEVLMNADWAAPTHAPVSVAANLLEARLVINRGAVFGIGARQRTFFIMFTIAAMIAGIIVFACSDPARWPMHFAIGLAMAGGIGNLYDRITFGVVRDFLQMMPGATLPFNWTWPGGSPELCPWVFNLADVFLLVGMLTLLVQLHARRATTAQLEVAHSPSA